MATLELPDSPLTKVARAVEVVLRDDPTLDRVVDLFKGSGDALSDRSGEPKDRRVAVRYRFRPGATDWYGPNAFAGPLDVDLTLDVEGLDPDDPMNLWFAIQRAFYPAPPDDPDGSKRLAIQQALRQAGAETGEVEFMQPADDPDEAPADSRWRAAGRLRVQVVTTII
jgi:hypothetical protein